MNELLTAVFIWPPFASASFYHILQQHFYSHVLNISLVLYAVWPWHWHCTRVRFSPAVQALTPGCVLCYCFHKVLCPVPPVMHGGPHWFIPPNSLNSSVVFLANSFLTLDSDNNTAAQRRVCWQGRAGVTQQTLAALLIVLWGLWMLPFSPGCKKELESWSQWSQWWSQWSQWSCVFSKD